MYCSAMCGAPSGHDRPSSSSSTGNWLVDRTSDGDRPRRCARGARRRQPVSASVRQNCRSQRFADHDRQRYDRVSLFICSNAGQGDRVCRACGYRRPAPAGSTRVDEMTQPPLAYPQVSAASPPCPDHDQLRSGPTVRSTCTAPGGKITCRRLRLRSRRTVTVTQLRATADFHAVFPSGQLQLYSKPRERQRERRKRISWATASVTRSSLRRRRAIHARGR